MRWTNILESLRMQGPYINVMKTVYSKPIAKINLNGKKLKAIPLKSEIRQSPFSPNLLKVVLKQ